MYTRELPDHDATEAFGRELGAAAKAGQVIGLVGTLGAGKTTLAGGIAAGAGSRAYATSPTFTLVHEYRDGHLPVYHLDFYRLESIHELAGIGWEDMLAAGGLVVVEWADRFPQAMPSDTLWVTIDAPDHGPRVAIVEKRESRGAPC